MTWRHRGRQPSHAKQSCLRRSHSCGRLDLGLQPPQRSEDKLPLSHPVGGTLSQKPDKTNTQTLWKGLVLGGRNQESQQQHPPHPLPSPTTVYCWLPRGAGGGFSELPPPTSVLSFSNTNNMSSMVQALQLPNVLRHCLYLQTIHWLGLRLKVA